MKRRVLLVEDERTQAMAVADRLESEGYAVSTASTGEAALETVTSETFDL